MRSVGRLVLLGIGTSGLASTAWAFQPPVDTHLGLEPQRVHRYHEHAQAKMLRSAAWQAWRDAYGEGWMARFDELTGTPHRMWGDGIDLGPIKSDIHLDRQLRAIFAQHVDLFGAEGSALKLRSAKYVPQSDMWYVDYDVTVGGTPVYDGGITARVKHNRLIMLGADTYPTTPVEGEFVLRPQDAITAAQVGGPHPDAYHTNTSVRARMLPWGDGSALHLRAAWEVYSETKDPVGKWVTFIDATTGEVLNVHNQVRFLTGNVTARHDTRTVDGNMSDSPLIGVTVATGGGATETDLYGDFSTSADGPFTVNFSNNEIQITNQGGADAAIRSSSPNMYVTSNDATQAEISTWVFLERVRRYWAQYAPGIGWAEGGEINVNVNLNDVCNAYFNGEINFFSAGGGCNNTGRIADVVYHEWGHGFHYHTMQSGTFDGSFSEGVSDVVAFILTDDAVTAPYFMTNGDGIRNADNNNSYPDDFVNNPSYVHHNGMIFSGAMWDLWEILRRKFGEQAGTEVASDLTVGIIRGGPQIEQTFDEAFVADDDDGNLQNGTPHGCEIIDAFSKHGLGPLGGSGLSIIGHEPISNAPAGQVVDVDVLLESPMPACFNVAASKGDVIYRVDGGRWNRSPLTVGAGATGSIPAQTAGAFVEYYIEINTDSGDIMRAPNGGRINPYTFYAGDVLPIRCDDFEDSDGGYTHELLSGAAEEGADDWQWGTVRGAGGDPNVARSGTRVWGNDLGEDGWNGEYQNDRHNRLTSPEIKLAHYQDAFLSYWRWLTIEDGQYDQATIYADGEPVWNNFMTRNGDGDNHHVDTQWMPHSVSLGDATDDGLVTLAFDLQTDAGLSFGGWTIDDVCVMAPATADNRLGIADFVVTEELEGRPTLTWTNPKHAPLQKVMVVRNSTAMPTAATDGIVVFEDDEPALGAEVSIVDETPYEDNGPLKYYAVYGFDGTTWLSWTVDGWNADTWDGPFTRATPGSEAPLTEVETAGCGCSTGSLTGVFGGLPLVLAFARRRK